MPPRVGCSSLYPSYRSASSPGWWERSIICVSASGAAGMNRARAFVPALILFLGTGSILQTHSQAARPTVAPVRSVLPQYDGYRASDQVLTKEEIDVAGMTDYVARAYRRDSVLAFTTLVSYYDRQTQGRTIHSPRNCLPGAGWDVLTPGTLSIVVGGRNHVVNHYVLKK